MPPQKKPSVREFIEMALAFSGWKCEVCKMPLKLVWIGEDDNPDLNFVECAQCNTEYVLLITFVKERDVPPELNQ